MGRHNWKKDEMKSITKTFISEDPLEDREQRNSSAESNSSSDLEHEALIFLMANMKQEDSSSSSE